MKVLFEPNSLLVSLFETYPSYFSVSTERLTKIRSARDGSRKLVGTDTNTDRLVVAKRIYFVWKVRNNFTMQWRPGRDYCSAGPWRQAPLHSLQSRSCPEQSAIPRATLYILNILYTAQSRGAKEVKGSVNLLDNLNIRRRLDDTFVSFQGSWLGIKMILLIITTLMIIVKIMPKMYKVLIPSRKISSIHSAK